MLRTLTGLICRGRVHYPPTLPLFFPSIVLLPGAGAFACFSKP